MFFFEKKVILFKFVEFLQIVVVKYCKIDVFDLGKIGFDFTMYVRFS